MRSNFDRALPLVLKHEGGYVDHPKDPGGATNKGVTIATFRAHVKPDATKEDLKRITPAQVAMVYRRHYWEALRCDELPAGLDYAVFDFGVNSGVSRAAKFLQQVLAAQGLYGGAIDSRIGPATLAAAGAGKTSMLIAIYMDKRLNFLKRLKTWPIFGRGWGPRVADVRATALEWADEPPPPAAFAALVSDAEEGGAASSSNWAALGTGGAGVLGTVFAAVSEPWVQALLIVVIAAGVVWMLRERERKAALGRLARRFLAES